MSPRNGGPSGSCVWLAVALLALLGAAVPACGDGGADPDDDAVDGGDTLRDGPETDGGLDEDGGAGAPCEMDFDCAEGQACRDGFCAVTSPDGWCPKLFDRPLRRNMDRGETVIPQGPQGERIRGLAFVRNFYVLREAFAILGSAYPLGQAGGLFNQSIVEEIAHIAELGRGFHPAKGHSYSEAMSDAIRDAADPPGVAGYDESEMPAGRSIARLRRQLNQVTHRRLGLAE